MTIGDQTKTMAKQLRAALASRDDAAPHATTLELVAASLGYDDWNTACTDLSHAAEATPRFTESVPILRIFDEATILSAQTAAHRLAAPKQRNRRARGEAASGVLHEACSPSATVRFDRTIGVEQETDNRSWYAVSRRGGPTE